MESELLDAIEQLLRDKFGDEVQIDRLVMDQAGVVNIIPYNVARSFANGISVPKALVEQYNSGDLLA